MNQKIIDWYADKKYKIEKIIEVGKTRHGLSEPQIEAAMEHCYHKIINGKPIRKIEIARYVFAVAKDIDCSKYAERIQAYKKFKDTIKQAEARIKKAESEINDLKEIVLIERSQALKKSNRIMKDALKEIGRIENKRRVMVENAYAFGVVVSVAVLIFGVLISSWS